MLGPHIVAAQGGDSMLRHIIGRLRDERGITGLETAIVLIAFVVVAAVFAFVVLSTGLFSAERGKDTVFAGLAKTRGSMELTGSIIGTSNGTELTHIELTFTLAAGGDSVNLDPAASNNRTVVSYHDTGVSDPDLTYTATGIVGDGDNLLEPGEIIQVAIDLTQNGGIAVAENETFWLEIKPPSGSYIVVQRTTPASMNETIINLN
jgi:flagellin FlaB